jgi:hypothetical protein
VKLPEIIMEIKDLREFFRVVGRGSSRAVNLSPPEINGSVGASPYRFWQSDVTASPYALWADPPRQTEPQPFFSALHCR